MQAGAGVTHFQLKTHAGDQQWFTRGLGANDNETDLQLSQVICQNHSVNNAEDDGHDAESQTHVVQYLGHPAAPLRRSLVAGVVGFTGLKNISK